MNIKIRKANKNEKYDILNIYKSLIGFPGCTWNEYYPTLEDVEDDLEKNSTYVICDDKKIIGAASARRDEELDTIESYSKESKYPCDLARVGVSIKYQNMGIGKMLLEYIEKDVKKMGFDSIRFLVSKKKSRALALYNKCGFSPCGNTIRYDVDWYCYEKMI